MPQRDLVIGAITNYTYDKVKYWVNSLNQSGFDGHKVVIAYNMDYDTADLLAKHGVTVIGFNRDEQTKRLFYPKPEQDYTIVVERFFHYYQTLPRLPFYSNIRYIIATDVKDVVFQKNPSEYVSFVQETMNDLLVSSEGIAYQHEPWGANNLLRAFGPFQYENHKTNIIRNCGVLAGQRDWFVSLAKLVYLISAGTIQHVPGGGGPDQAALNMILATDPFQYRTFVATHREPWAAQLGTMMDPSKLDAYKPFIHEPLPKFVPGVGVTTATDELFHVVHQWDRVPEVKQFVEEKYS